MCFVLSVRPYTTVGESPEPLLKVAALNAFWLADETSLDYLARSLGIVVSSGSGLHETLLHEETSLPEGDILHIVAKRLARLRNMNAWCEGSGPSRRRRPRRGEADSLQPQV